MRRTPEELAAMHEAKAKEHKRRARIAGSEALSEVEAVRKRLVRLASFSEGAVHEAALLAQDPLLKVLEEA